MSRLPTIRARILIRILLNLGFVESRSKGSHRIFKHQDGRKTVVPMHQGEDIGRGLLRTILRQIHVSSEEFQKLVKIKN